MVVIGAAIQSSLFAFYPLTYLQPDVVLLAVIWFALNREFTKGGILTLIVGEVAEIHSSCPRGTFLTTYMFVYLGIRLLSRYVMVPRLSSLVGLTFFASAAWKLATLGVLHLLDAAGNQWRHTLIFLVPGALIEGAAGIWIFRRLELYDRATFEDARAG